MSTGKLLSCVALAAFLSMALAGAAPFAYITNSGDGTASVIDIASNTVIATVSGLPGAYGVAANASGTRVYVTNNGYGRVSVIDTSSNTVIATIVGNSSGPGPVGVAVNASETRVYVANQSTASVSVIDTSSNAVIATVSVGINPVGVAVNADGTRVYVATLHGVNGSETVFSVIDTTSNSVVATTIYALNVSLGPGPTPFGIAVNPAGTRAYADAYSSPSAFVAVLDAVSNLLVAENPNLAGFPAGGIAVNPAGTRYYVTSGGAAGEVNVLNTSNLIVATVPVGVNPVGVSVTPDGAPALCCK